MPATIRFGTDGWRAIIAEDYTFANVRLCSQAVAQYLLETKSAEKGLVIGYDTRFGSEMFAAAAAEVLAGSGIKTYLCDRFAPTPTISYSIIDKGAAGAIVITASHNPKEWNGFKYKPEYAGSASPEVITALEGHIQALQEGKGEVRSMALEGALGQGLVVEFDPRPAYLAQLGRLVDLAALKEAGLKVIVDCMYGAGLDYFPALLGGGKTTIMQINAERNPLFPGMHNPEPIASNLEALMKAVPKEQAEVGLVNDGDADRLGLVDEKGAFINQLQVCALLLLYLLEARGLRGPVVRTVTSTVMVDKLARLYGVPSYETAVGFKFVGPKMMETNAIMGGEESGGYGFRGHIPERDGILAGLYLLDFMVKSGKSVSELVAHLYDQVGPHYYQRLDLGFPPKDREAIIARMRAGSPERLASLEVVEIKTIDGFKFNLADGSWLLVRFSGTEPIMRIYSEAQSIEIVERLLLEGRSLAGL